MSLKLNSSGGGSVTLQEPATASALTLDLPAVNGTVVSTGDTGTITSAMIANGTVTPTDLSQPMTLATAQNTTSGTAIDFTGIPSWVRKITVMFNGVSLNGSAHILIQLGTSSGVESTSYSSASVHAVTGNTVGGVNSTSGFVLYMNSSANITAGVATIATLGSNVWAMSYCGGLTNVASAHVGGGVKTLGATLDRVRITSSNGTDAFDAGSVNIMYEG